MTVTPASPPQTRSPLTELWYTRCPVPTASSVAIANGWLAAEFEPDGITVSSLRASRDRSVQESHFDHRQANSFRQGGNIPAIWARANGGDLRLIGLSWADQYQAIVTLPDSDIRDPTDLKGRRLALSRRLNDQIDFWRATALHGYESALGHVGLTLGDVELVDLPVDESYILPESTSPSGSLFGAYTQRRLQAAEVLALIRREVDAIYIAGGRGPDLEAMAGVRVVFDLLRTGEPALRVNNITPATLTVSGELLDSRPDLVARYLAATIRAARWAATHPEQTRRIIAHEVGVAEDFVAPGYPDEIHRRLEPSLDARLIDAVEQQQRFLHRHGFINHPFDVVEWVDERPLAEALALIAADRPPSFT